jgi:hypothetical protein
VRFVSSSALMALTGLYAMATWLPVRGEPGTELPKGSIHGQDLFILPLDSALLLPGTYDPAVLETGDPLLMVDDEDETCLQLSLTHLGEQKPETKVTVFVDSGASILRTPTVGALQIAMGECSKSSTYDYEHC